MKLKMIIFIITVSTSQVISQKNELTAYLGYNYYEDNFFVNSSADDNGFKSSPYGLLKLSAGFTYSYYFKRDGGWFLSSGLQYAYRSSVVGITNESGFATEFHQKANYLDVCLGTGYEIKVDRSFSIAPRLFVGLGVPLQGEKEENQSGGPIRDPDQHFTQFLFYTAKGITFKRYFSESWGNEWWIGIEPRLLIFYNNMYDLNKYPLATNEAPHFAGGLELQVGFSFW